MVVDQSNMSIVFSWEAHRVNEKLGSWVCVCVCLTLCFLWLVEKNLLVPLHAHMNKRRLQEPIGARDTPPTLRAKVVHFSYSQPLSRLCHLKLSDLLRKHCKELSNLCSVESVWSTPSLARAASCSSSSYFARAPLRTRLQKCLSLFDFFRGFISPQ